MAYKDKNDFESVESGTITFDFRGFLFKVLSFWKLILLCLGIAMTIAYFNNVRKQNIYRLDSLISIENDQNPFFTANTSISFNWGGVSGKVGKMITAIKTRTHNEKVVDSLQFYMQYLVEGKYRKTDIYKNAPFYLELDKSKGQILNKPIGIRFINDTSFEIFSEFESDKVSVQYYDTKTKLSVNVPQGPFLQSYTFGESVQLPFLNATIHLKPSIKVSVGSEFFVNFLSFDNVVNSYRSSMKIEPFSKTSSSVLRLSLTGNNKSKIVDYLNATTAILSKSELERKNLYATNTIRFIDSSLATVSTNLKDVTDEMNEFRRQNKVFDVDDEISQISNQLKIYDNDKQVEQSKLNYLNRLENYLSTKTEYTKIAAPTSVGIEEINILNSVSKITSLAIERQNLEYTAKEGNVLFNDLDRQIDAERNVLLETIKSTKYTLGIQLNTISKNIAELEAELSDLPEDQQEYLKIQRKLDISLESYNVYQAKRSEAAIVKAANVSDINVIDEAKDIGGGLIGPNKSLNYMMALMVGSFTPLLFILIIFLFDNNIHGSEDVEQLSRIPIIGLVGKYKHDNNLVVYDKPKSAVAESFRAIRSSLQFIYKRQDVEGGRTLMVTSSVSGEGKTYCSINIATVHALSGKKTILLGLDLRKPKIFGDFNIANDLGVVNYLIGEKTVEDITFKTQIENLSIVPSGPIPPNPSELLMSDRMKILIEQLKKDYDMIVIDTPPLGLVADSIELTQYADATIFVIRLNYTKKGMLKYINTKYKAGEVKNISFILNFYKHKANYNYDYGYGYGYGYGVYGNAYHEGQKKTILNRIKKAFKINT
jgi:tyrosine-protein kinase Etk/Wzc